MDFSPDYGAAIAGIESAGLANPYAALGPQTKNGDRAYGKYQMMGANIPDWTDQYLGQRMTPEELMSHPKTAELQDKLFNSRFGDYIQKYGNPQDAASAWFTGRPLAQGGNSADLNGTTGNSYVDKFNAMLAKQPGAAQAQDNSVLPPNATPTEGVLSGLMNQQQTPPAIPAADRLMGGQDKMGMLTNNMGDLGIALMALSNPGAASVMQSQLKDTRSVQLQRDTQAATFRALVANGVSPAEASAAALNPDVMKAVASSRFEAKPPTVVDGSEDPIFGTKPRFIQEYVPGKGWTFRPLTSGGPAPLPGQAPQQGGATALPPGVKVPPASPQDQTANLDGEAMVRQLQQAKQNGATPEQMKQLLPPILRPEVDALIEGRDTTQALARNSKLRNSLPLITQLIDPSYNTQTGAMRNEVAKSMGRQTPGSYGGLITGYNKAISHLGSYLGNIEGLPNTDEMKFLNGPRNSVLTNLGFTKVQDGLTKAQTDATGLATEATRVLGGGHDSQAMRDIWLEKLDPKTHSPTEMKAAATELVHLMRGQMNALTQQYNYAYGKDVGDDFFLRPENKALYKRVTEGTAAPSAPAPSATGGFKVLKVTH
jgi:hypothetical protein